jgi:hypothetical protein
MKLLYRCVLLFGFAMSVPSVRAGTAASSAAEPDGRGLGEQLELVAHNVNPIVVNDTGHSVLDDRPITCMPALAKLL